MCHMPYHPSLSGENGCLIIHEKCWNTIWKDKLCLTGEKVSPFSAFYSYFTQPCDVSYSDKIYRKCSGIGNAARFSTIIEYWCEVFFSPGQLAKQKISIFNGQIPILACDSKYNIKPWDLFRSYILCLFFSTLCESRELFIIIYIHLTCKHVVPLASLIPSYIPWYDKETHGMNGRINNALPYLF